MKDQYFGDFGDYQKISLLKSLQKQGIRTLVYWMKTKDDSSADGKHIAYLQKPNVWRYFDPATYDFVKARIASERRSLSHIEENLHSDSIKFVNDYIEDGTTRDRILKDLVNDTSDLIFFDPDNGIEVASTNKRNIHKYATWKEITEAFNSGKSVVVYQHFSRSNRDMFVKNKKTEIQERVGGKPLSVRVRHSVYFFILQDEHKKAIREALLQFAQTWKNLAVVA